MFDSKEATFALDVVCKASRLVRRVRHEMVTEALTKEDRSPVTVADFAVQALVGHLLLETFPDDSLVGEEDSEALRAPESYRTLEQVTHFVGHVASGATPEAICDWIDLGAGDSTGRFWVLDPVDGTKGFLRGEQYVVALALIEDGKVRLGALGCPNLTDGWRPDIGGPGSVLMAAVGEGTWTTPLSGGEFQGLAVSKTESAVDARLLRSFESGHTNVDTMDRLIETLDTKADPVLMDSQAKYAVLAAGSGDLLFRLISSDRPDYREMIWDQAAGSLVVEEAGGRVTDLTGKPLDFTQGRTLAGNRGVVASNGRLHEAALEALKRVGA